MASLIIGDFSLPELSDRMVSTLEAYVRLLDPMFGEGSAALSWHTGDVYSTAINRYLGEHNRKPKSFVWTADPDRIIEKVHRGYQAMVSNH